MRQIANLVALVAAVLIFAAPSLAQNQYRLEFFGAGYIPMDKDFEISAPQSTSPLSGTHEFSPGARGGIRLGVDGSGHWGQDITYSYGNNASRIVNHTTGHSFAFTNRVHQIAYNAVWYPTGIGDRTVTPFLTAGFGATLYHLDSATVNEALDPNRGGLGKLQNDNIFAFNAGAGVRIRINKLYGFRLDVRDYMTRPARYRLPQSSDDPNSTVFPVTGIFHQFQFSFAFVYYF